MKILTKHLVSLAVLSLFALASATAVLPAKADQTLLDSQTGLGDIGNTYGSATPTDIRTVVAQIIDVVLGLLGVVFIVLMVYAGFKYMTSAGNEEKTSEALGLIRNAVIGLIIVLLSWVITRLFVYVLGRVVMNNAVDPWQGAFGN